MQRIEIGEIQHTQTVNESFKSISRMGPYTFRIISQRYNFDNYTKFRKKRQALSLRDQRVPNDLFSYAQLYLVEV